MANKELDSELVRKLAEILNETGLTEIEYGGDDWHIRVAKEPAPVAATAVAAAPQPAPAAPATVPDPATAALDEMANHPGAVTSPMVGVAYLTPEPESPPFIREGDTVSEGQTLLLVEAMKVFNPIHAPRGGKVTRILVESGSPVEFGEPLVIVE